MWFILFLSALTIIPRGAFALLLIFSFDLIQVLALFVVRSFLFLLAYA